MSNENESSGAAVAEPSGAEQAAAVAEPGKKVKKAKSTEPKVKKERVARTDTVHATLWKLYGRNASFETICKEIKEKHPDSAFNKSPENQKVHFNYYKVKYNAEQKKTGGDLCTSKGPEKMAKEAKPKIKKEKAAAGAEAK